MSLEPMSEMLGNQYFMARNYAAAAVQLAGALIKHPASKAIRRRLIICYIQTGMIQKAFLLFRNLVKEDADFIINTDPVDDDCPCAELVKEGESVYAETACSLDSFLKMGMLWLYCDVQHALDYFNQAMQAAPDDQAVAEIAVILKNKLVRDISVTFHKPYASS